MRTTNRAKHELQVPSPKAVGLSTLLQPQFSPDKGFKSVSYFHKLPPVQTCIARHIYFPALSLHNLVLPDLHRATSLKPAGRNKPPRLPAIIIWQPHTHTTISDPQQQQPTSHSFISPSIDYISRFLVSSKALLPKLPHQTSNSSTLSSDVTHQRHANTIQRRPPIHPPTLSISHHVRLRPHQRKRQQI